MTTETDCPSHIEARERLEAELRTIAESPMAETDHALEFLCTPEEARTLLATPTQEGVGRADAEAAHVAGVRAVLTARYPDRTTWSDQTIREAIADGFWSDYIIAIDAAHSLLPAPKPQPAPAASIRAFCDELERRMEFGGYLTIQELSKARDEFVAPTLGREGVARPTTEEIQSWITRAYREPDDRRLLDIYRFTRWNMEVAYSAGFDHCLTERADPGAGEELKAKIKDLEAALKVCRQSLVDQAAARADPTMPILTAEVREALRENAEAAYALAEEQNERIEAHGLSLLCDWQDRAAAIATTPSPASTSSGEPAPGAPEGWREALAAQRAWHDLRADLAWDGAREAHAEGDVPAERRLMAAHAEHHRQIDAIDAALTSSSAKPGGEAWQPIETAPKDGQHILACDVSRDFGVIDGQQLPPRQTVVHWWGNPGEEGFYTSVNETAPERPFTATHWKRLDGPQ